MRQDRYTLKELCNLIDIPFELLSKVRDNKEFIIRQLSEQSSMNKTILEVISEFIIELDSRVEQTIITIRSKKNYVDFFQPFSRFINAYYPDKDIAGLDQAILTQYLKQCKVLKRRVENENIDQNGINKHTRNAYTKYIRSLLYFAMEKGYYYHLNGNESIKKAFHYSKPERLPRSIPDEIVKAVLLESRKTQEAYRNHGIICFLLGTGARVDELVKVKISDVNFKNNMVKLVGKYGRTRFVPLYPRVKEVLKAYIDLITKHCEKAPVYLFTTNYVIKQKQMDVSTVQDMISDLFKKVGYENEYSTHCFRHTYAVNCLKAKMKIEFISELLGHNSIEATLIYTKLLPQDLVDEAQKYPLPLEKILFTLLNIEEEVSSSETDD